MELKKDVGLSVAFLLMVLINFIGNSLVILVILLNRSMRTPMNWLILNLAIADIVVAAFFAIQFGIGPIYTHSSGTTGSFLCKFITGGTLAWTPALVSVCNLVAISVERYHAVIKPLTIRSKLTKTKLKFIIASCWFAGFLWNAPLFVVVTYRDDLRTCGERWSSPSLPIIYSIGWGVVAGIIPICIMGYLYSRVIWKLWFQKTPAVQSASTNRATLYRKKATVTVFIVSVIYNICWVPVLVMYVLAQTLSNQAVHSNLHRVTILLTMFNSSINPVIYSFKCARFRRHVVKLLKLKCYRGRLERGLGRI